MTSGQGAVRGVMEWAVASRPFPGEVVSGDRHVVLSRPDGAFVAVVDGLGHGEEAARAASDAAEVLARAAHEPLDAIVERCDRALVGSRGVALSAAVVDGSRGLIRWVGVGNVEGVLLSPGGTTWVPRARLLNVPGIVGNRAPRVRPVAVPLTRSDVLVFATDGVGKGFAEDIPSLEAVLGTPEQILSKHARDTDDALVLIALLRGDG